MINWSDVGMRINWIDVGVCITWRDVGMMIIWSDIVVRISNMKHSVYYLQLLLNFVLMATCCDVNSEETTT